MHQRSEIFIPYNVARVNEQPIPPVRYTSVRCAENTDDDTHEDEFPSTEIDTEVDIKQESFEFVSLKSGQGIEYHSTL